MVDAQAAAAATTEGLETERSTRIIRGGLGYFQFSTVFAFTGIPSGTTPQARIPLHLPSFSTRTTLTKGTSLTRQLTYIKCKTFTY